MLRSRVVLDLLAARQAARQTGEQQLQAKSQPITRIRNRPALHTSSSPKVQSRPFHRQDVSTAAPRITTSGASSVILARLQARKERLAAACSSSDKASIPGKRETWATVRQRHATRPSGGASSKKPGEHSILPSSLIAWLLTSCQLPVSLSTRTGLVNSHRSLRN